MAQNHMQSALSARQVYDFNASELTRRREKVRLKTNRFRDMISATMARRSSRNRSCTDSFNESFVRKRLRMRMGLHGFSSTSEMMTMMIKSRSLQMRSGCSASASGNDDDNDGVNEKIVVDFACENENNLASAVRFLGWDIVHCKTNERIGRVRQILAASNGDLEIEVEATGDGVLDWDSLGFLDALSGGYGGRRVVSGGDADDAAGAARENDEDNWDDDVAVSYTLLVQKDFNDDDSDDESNWQYIPFAPTMFPKMIPSEKILFIDPPIGLLRTTSNKTTTTTTTSSDEDINSIELNDLELKEAFDTLRDDLMPYAKTLGDNLFGMPSKRSLEKEGRKDLIKRVEKFFGYDWLTMAVLLDFEPFRKPFYYWDNIENLSDELRALVFALWFEQDDGEGKFWYNDISGAISFEKPDEDDKGNMVMPTRRDLIDARRWDLHHAVVLHGGYGAVAKELRWPRARWAEDRHLLNFEIFSKELLGCMENELIMLHNNISNDNNDTRIPSANELRNIGRDDLAKHMVEHGGPVMVAKRLELKPGKGAWIRARREYDVNSFKAYLKTLVEDVLAFAVKTKTNKNEIVFMPTDEDLVNAGRHDLRYRIKEIGSATVAKYAKLPNRTDKLSYADARTFLHKDEVQKKYFKRGKRVEFVQYVKEEQASEGKLLPWNMPLDPVRYYRQKKEWVSWSHFLLKEEKNNEAKIIDDI